MHLHARMIAVLFGLALAAPSLASDVKGRARDAAADVGDTADQAAHDARRTVRQHKPGGEDLGDKTADAKDSAKSKSDQAKRKARHARQKARAKARDATR